MTLTEQFAVQVILEYARAISRELEALRAQGVKIMATLEEVQTKLEAINTAIAEERAEVQGLLEGLRQQVQELQDQIGAGQLVTQEQLDGIGTSLDDAIAKVRAISEPVAA